jgi:hypothetical protein
MFLLLASLDELGIPEHERPLLPSLRHAAEAELDILVCPLLANATDPEIPMIAYGTDTPSSLRLLKASRTDDRDELHAKAIPKSRTSTWSPRSLGTRKMFCGLRSRWMIPRAWAAASEE